MQIWQRRRVRDIRKRLKNREEHRRRRNPKRLPLPENHNGKRKEAKACHADLEIPNRNRGHDVRKAAQAA